MNKEIDFETYLIISDEKLEIYLLDIKNYKNLYKNELDFESDSEKKNLSFLGNFLEENIYKIEKLAGNFVNNINIVIENKSILSLDLSVKKKNYSENFSKIFLERVLKEVNDLFKQSYNKYKLMHIIINKYTIDGESYTSFKDEIKINEICLEIKLISISNLIIFEIENILKKYQIKISNYIDKNYLNSFAQEKKINISILAHKLKNGMNRNEVQITSKFTKKLSFFEKFFQLFS